MDRSITENVYMKKERDYKKKFSYSGKRYGKLLVQDYFYKNKDLYYNCICDCGNKSEVRQDCFERKVGPIRSCGCLRKLTMKSNQLIGADKRWLGGNKAAKRALKQYYKANAKRRGHIFDLNDDEFYTLVQGNCHYCGIPPNTEQKIYKSKIDKIYESYIYNGIDRINSELGYTMDNCQTCCVHCNRAKQDMTNDEFLKLIKKIYDNHIAYKPDKTPQQKAEEAYQDAQHLRYRLLV